MIRKHLLKEEVMPFSRSCQTEWSIPLDLLLTTYPHAQLLSREAHNDDCQEVSYVEGHHRRFEVSQNEPMDLSINTKSEPGVHQVSQEVQHIPLNLTPAHGGKMSGSSYLSYPRNNLFNYHPLKRPLRPTAISEDSQSYDAHLNPMQQAALVCLNQQNSQPSTSIWARSAYPSNGVPSTYAAALKRPSYAIPSALNNSANNVLNTGTSSITTTTTSSSVSQALLSSYSGFSHNNHRSSLSTEANGSMSYSVNLASAADSPLSNSKWDVPQNNGQVSMANSILAGTSTSRTGNNQAYDLSNQPAHSSDSSNPPGTSPLVSSTTIANEISQRTIEDLKARGRYEICQICSDTAAGFHCGAFVCEACKKFFIRAQKQSLRGYSCTGLRSIACVITRDTRTSCSFCRYKKCLDAGMHPPGSGILDTTKVSNLPCKVCGSPASGFHFGALTCEGCKGFFRRCIKDTKKNSLFCQKDGKCEVDSNSRQTCRACRFQRCLKAGMSEKETRIGRQPNSVRYARIIATQQEKNEALKEEPSSMEQNAVASSAVNNSELEVLKATYLVLRNSVNCYKDPIVGQDVNPEKCAMEINQYFEYCIQSVLTFVNTLSGFNDLDEDDQTILMKHSLYAIMILLASDEFDTKSGQHKVFFMDSEETTVERFSLFFPEYKVLLLHFQELCKRIKSLELDIAEQCIFVIILIFNPDDGSKLRNTGAISDVRDYYDQMLTAHVNAVYGRHVNRMATLQLLLSEMKRASQQQVMAAKLFCQNHQSFDDGNGGNLLNLDDVYEKFRLKSHMKTIAAATAHHYDEDDSFQGS